MMVLFSQHLKTLKKGGNGGTENECKEFRLGENEIEIRSSDFQ